MCSKLCHCQEGSSCLILLDVMMEPMNGWRFSGKDPRRIRLKDIPVILFTASLR